jgi:hypothetical protein
MNTFIEVSSNPMQVWLSGQMTEEAAVKTEG